jgi:hypothetical protein
MKSPSPKFETHLVIDALYFHAARQAHARAKDAVDSIKEAEQSWRDLENTEQQIISRYEQKEFGGHYEEIDTSSYYDEIEQISIRMESAHYTVGKSYAPLIKEIAVVHILCTAALEAHINSVANEALKGKELTQFEKLGLEAKWLFLPKILGYGGFNPGSQPFQGFSQMLKHRNALVHYKSIREDWVQGTVPQFISKIGLTLKQSEMSIKYSDKMIRELCKQRGVEAPIWLRSDLNDISYFGLIIS